MAGWVSLHRKILDNPTVCKDSDYFAVWGYLLLNATHKEQKKIFAGEPIILRAGQMITGRKKIAAKFSISESKVQRILKRYETEHQIEQQMSNKNRLVTVLNWEDYQNPEQQTEQLLNIKRTTSEQQVNTNNNVNKGIRVIKDLKERNKKEKGTEKYTEDWEQRLKAKSGCIGKTDTIEGE